VVLLHTFLTSAIPITSYYFLNFYVRVKGSPTKSSAPGPVLALHVTAYGTIHIDAHKGPVRILIATECKHLIDSELCITLLTATHVT